MERDCGVMKTPMALKVSSFGFMRTILSFFFRIWVGVFSHNPVAVFQFGVL